MPLVEPCSDYADAHPDPTHPRGRARQPRAARQAGRGSTRGPVPAATDPAAARSPSGLEPVGDEPSRARWRRRDDPRRASAGCRGAPDHPPRRVSARSPQRDHGRRASCDARARSAAWPRGWVHRLVRAGDETQRAVALRRRWARSARGAPPDPRRVLEHDRRHRGRGAVQRPEASGARGDGRRPVGRGRHDRARLGRARHGPQSGVDRYPELFASRFPGSSRGWVDALTKGTPPPGQPGLVWSDVAGTRLFAWRRRPG